MRKMNFNHFKGISILFTGFLLGLFMLYGCATRKPQPRVSVYKFNFEGEDYRIRSIFPGNKQESYNQLIGKNFVAIDLAQDRIIDRITMGTVSWDEVQKIYEYGLEMAAKENKLQERLPAVNRYIQESSDFYYEIRSFQPTNVFPFNEFKIIDKRQTPPQVIILVDQQADGTLDEVLEGTVTLEEAQPRYSEIIKVGLEKRQLIKVDNRILVKELFKK